MMVRFIDDHRAEYGVELICRVLPIAPSTYHRHKAVEADPELRSERTKRDEQLCVEIQRVFDENFEVYGVRKVWRQLVREKTKVARLSSVAGSNRARDTQLIRSPMNPGRFTLPLRC